MNQERSSRDTPCMSSMQHLEHMLSMLSSVSQGCSLCPELKPNSFLPMHHESWMPGSPRQGQKIARDYLEQGTVQAICLFVLPLP